MANISLFAKLISIQNDLKVPKSQMNKFGGYKYRSCEDILEAVKPLCIKQGLLLSLTDEAVLIGDWHYIKATATIQDTEGGKLEVSALARESEIKKGMDASQITGTASSYARKYALNGLFCIDDTKDADTDGYAKTTQSEEPKPKPRELSDAQIKRLYTIATKHGIKSDDVKKYSVIKYTKEPSDLNKREYDELVTKLEKTEDKK